MIWTILTLAFMALNFYLNILAARLGDRLLSAISLIGFSCCFASLMIDLVKPLH